MEDKTPLERDIERIELFKTPLSVKILLVLLIACVAVLGIYAIDLKKKVSAKEQEIAEMKDDFQDERLELIQEIRRLSDEVDELEPE